MARFIHLAIAAADEALQMANYKVENEEQAERTGVDIGSGSADSTSSNVSTRTC